MFVQVSRVAGAKPFYVNPRGTGRPLKTTSIELRTELRCTCFISSQFLYGIVAHECILGTSLKNITTPINYEDTSFLSRTIRIAKTRRIFARNWAIKSCQVCQPRHMSDHGSQFSVTFLPLPITGTLAGMPAGHKSMVGTLWLLLPFFVWPKVKWFVNTNL